jgi:hypothetical protein
MLGNEDACQCMFAGVLGGFETSSMLILMLLLLLQVL